ncbi:Ig-like domain-containing protein [Pedobacter frigoris]|uniref:Ig domain-containing protein n=1 Tax=Pedobacter frigoris TaxID=2571272 RepID=A0A4U1CMN7_9SPHI|nr:Ig-like domain-containing protein [Pedobacter frigoris]TKC09147.1 Ig domain-containing protein [Pedobacter frigoris]
MFKLKLPYSWFIVLLFAVMFVVLSGSVASAQCTAPTRVYADDESHRANGSHVVTLVTLARWSTQNSGNVVGANALDNPATLRTEVILNLGVAESWIQMKFLSSSNNPTLPIPAGTTTYVKIGGSSSAGLLGLIGGGNVVASAYQGATAGSDGTKIASGVAVSTITTPSGTTYLAITPNTTYNSVRVTLVAPTLLTTTDLYVYHAFYQMAGYNCDPALGASTSVTGLLTLGGAVNNPGSAIDNDKSTNATLTMGVAGVGTTLKETAYFPGPSNSGDAATITFSIPPALLLDLSLLDNITMTPYNGSTAGSPVSLTSLLSIDLLALLRDNKITTVSLVPPSTFDRIEISMSSLVGVLAQMNLYEVQRTPPKPTFTLPASQSVTICSGLSTTLSATAGSCNELHWYTVPTGGTATVGNTYNTGTLTTTTIFYVAAARIGCTAESERVPVTVTINPLPPAPTVPGTAICNGTSTTLSVTSSDANYTYKWYTLSSGGSSFNTGTSYITPTLTTATDYYVEATNNTTTCVGPRTKVTVNINPLPSAGTITGNASVCLGQTTSLTNATPGGVWTSSDETKATVDATGTVTGVAVGTATIIYTVTNGVTGCTSFTTQAVTINALPVVNLIIGNSSLCVGNTITLANTTPGGIWASSNPTSATINSSGLVTALVAGQTIITYTVTSNGCSTPAMRVIDINPLPTASISGTTTICQGATSPTITFTGAVGTAPYTFTYNINGGSSTTITTSSGNSVSLTIPTTSSGTFNYNLISVKDNSSTQCAQSQSGTATIIINPKPLHPVTSISSN